MSICKTYLVKKARKDQGTCASCHQPIKAGSAYIYWNPRYGPRKQAHRGCHVPLSMRETNDTMATYLQAQEALENANTEDHEEAASAVEEAISLLESVKETLDERVQNWQGTNLENTQRYWDYEAFVSEADSHIDTMNSALSDLQGLEKPQEPEGYGETSEDETMADADDDYELEMEDYESAIQSALEEASALPDLNI